MAATFTLAAGAIPTAIGQTNPRISTEAITGLAPGVFLFIGRELMKVLNVGAGAGGIMAVQVQRGQAGTHASSHAAGSIAYVVPTGDMVYDQDPQGLPPAQPYVLPYINVQSGRMWWPVGDELGPGVGARVWQIVTPGYGIGPLGVRATTASPSGAS